MAAGVGCRHYRDIDIAGSVNSQAGRMVESGGERALCAIRREFGDGMFVSHEEITGCVTGWAGESKKRLGNDERTLYSFGREFENRMSVRQKEITGCIKSQRTGTCLDRNHHCCRAQHRQDNYKSHRSSWRHEVHDL